MENVDRNFENEAQRQGWKPKEQFVADGRPETDWVDAQTFVERGESSAGILKSRLEKNERRLQYVEEVNKSLTSHHERMLQKEKAKRESLIRELEDARADAVAKGDANTFKNADRQIENLKEQNRNEVVELPKGPDPEIEGWLGDNAWYNEEDGLRNMADGYAEKLRASNPTLKGRAFLDKVTAYVKQNAPKKEAPRGSNVETESDKVPTRKTNTEGSTKRSYENLPPEAKKDCTRLMKQIKGFTKEQYVDYYDWE